jgi:sugar-specific transcriptional regulator TrmB
LISRESDVPQSKIYEILEQLVHKQLVYVFEGRPKEYKAAEPRNALKHLLEARAKEIESLKTDIKAMSEFLKPVREDEVIGGIWTTKGQKFKEFFNMVTEMLERSEKYAYAISRDFSRSAGIGEVLRKCAKRGVKVRMIGMEPLEGDNYLKAKWYKDHGVEVRIFQTKVHPRIIVVDGKELLLRLDYNTKKRDRFIFSSVWSEDRSLVNVIDSYVKNMWDDAEPAKFQRNLPTMP